MSDNEKWQCEIWQVEADRSRYLFWSEQSANEFRDQLGAAGGGFVSQAQVLGVNPTAELKALQDKIAELEAIVKDYRTSHSEWCCCPRCM